MSAVCPDGHRTASTDYCDVCGLPVAGTLLGGGGLGGMGGGGLGGTSGGMGGGGGAPVPSHAGPLAPPSPARDALKPCPHCGADAPSAALFCEDCGYDFTTGALPPPPGPAPNPGAATSPLVSGGESGTAPAPAAAAGAGAPPLGNGADAIEWVAEVWVDPDWYATQDSGDPCPSAGMPVVVPLPSRSVLVGRRSVSRNITPHIDCGADSGVSRRHAQLTTDGQRWWIEDLQSSNGTYVGQAGGTMPTMSLPPGQKTELAPGDRIYVGAYTRIVVRRATPDEQ